MGYIGGSPVHPRTAFSIRLLRFFHCIWKHGAVRTQAFVRALDEYLDAHNPLILTAKTQQVRCKALEFNELTLTDTNPPPYQPRDWRTPFSAAYDAYRTLVTMVRYKEFELLQMSELDRLAANCPRCFGPPVATTEACEPDIIVCLDGNFQHRRHKAASVPIPGYSPPNPELFLPKTEWERMASRIGADVNNPEDDDIDMVGHRY